MSSTARAAQVPSRATITEKELKVRKNCKLHRLPENNLYRDARDMYLVSFLIYVWSKVADVLKEELRTSQPRQGGWSPRDVKTLILAHQPKLADRYPAEFNDGSITFEALDVLLQRSPNRELSLVKWDSDFQSNELVYGICQDSINQRITVVFRGTDTSTAFKSNWEANVNVGKSCERLPETLMGKLPSGKNQVWIHSGFHEYLNKPTEDPTDHVEMTKKEQVLNAVKEVLAQYPTYRIYVTGHSLGAALATLTSYYLATNTEFSPNAPITCLNFASPRVGDSNFLDAVQVLERKGLLRICRFVNENDLVCVLPTLNYHHVGFMIKLNEESNRQSKVKVCYPKFGESWHRWWDRALSMSWPAAFNLTYDHSSGEYGRRVELHKKQLERLFLDKLYRDETRTGFVKTEMFGTPDDAY